MCIIDYGKEIAINILEKTYNTVELEDEDVEIVDNVQMQVISKDTQYWVECYYTGDHDSYVIRVYNDDRGLELEDTEVEQAIMETLFGKDGIIIPF